MDLIYLKSFMEAARCKSFTKAAENLGYVQSSVTTHIQKLEIEYGVVLFERIGRSMRLTSAGEQLYETFGRILELYEESKNRISRQVKGHLQIGTIESLIAFFLPDVFCRFRNAFPQISMQVYPLLEAGILQGIRSGQLDLGIMVDRPFADDDLHSLIIREEPLVLVAEPGHPLSKLGAVDVAALAGQSYIATETGCAYRGAFERLLRDHGVEYHVYNEFGSLEAIKQCVSFGLGIGLLPRIAVVRELEEGRLIALPFKHHEITFYTQIVYHKKKWLDPSIRHMIDLLMETEAESA
ncbi:LysR family transcriptional regulator [Cohnella sp. CFH 77786]|uniref:LysR family transcriptional regulator n=1 Tax=Cohnella sp. CFH 77786 TaxID=2662265 RepID=UPI001C610A89|nr:LysR family transcriptional regulator [Cohnella sp. CFH 77786]MBW5447930.1 LysR family transcriptional regulator [Cohnella sp. CFH 77786]